LGVSAQRIATVSVFKQRYSQTQLRDLAAHPREFYRERPALEKTEGAGKAGCPLHPQPRVQNKQSTRA
jgi:hypothetical protein